MPRQRFIWPSIWDDPDLASISEGAMLLYIACFSLADDEGRLDGNAAFLRSQAFPYRKVSTRRVRSWRDEIARACSKFHIYNVNGREYIAFRNWREFQKPKYPSPSKLPAPEWDSGNDSGNDSPNVSPTPSRNDSSVGWVGLGTTPYPQNEEGEKRDKRTRRGKGTNPRATGTNPRALRGREHVAARALHFVKTHGHEYPDHTVLADELRDHFPSLNTEQINALLSEAPVSSP